MAMWQWKVQRASVQADVRGIAAGETVVETVIDATHVVIGIQLMLKITVALVETSTAEVGALELDQDRLTVTDITGPVAIDLAVMKMREFETGVLVVTVSLSESELRAPSANLLHPNPPKTSVIEGRFLCNSWLPD